MDESTKKPKKVRISKSRALAPPPPIVYQPNKFCRGDYDPKFCDDLIEHAETGLSFEAFAGVCRVSVSTLYDWANRHAEFAEAKKQFFALSQIWWEKKGINAIENPHFKTAVWIYNMRNRFRWKDARTNPDVDQPEGSGDEVYETQWGGTATDQVQDAKEKETKK